MCSSYSIIIPTNITHIHVRTYTHTCSHAHMRTRKHTICVRPILLSILPTSHTRTHVHTHVKQVSHYHQLIEIFL